jgi:hypothetical protein
VLQNDVSRKLFGRCKSRGLLSQATGSQLLEFAFVLPFLLVFVAGIIDFGQAYNLKQILNNAAREGARFAAIPENQADVNCGSACIPAPASVTAVRDVVADYLTNAGVTSCTLNATPQYSVANQAWTYSSSSSGCNGFSLEIDRWYNYLNGTAPVVGSRVILTYPYNWVLFGRIIQLQPFNGSSYGTSINITTDAIMENNQT